MGKKKSDTQKTCVNCGAKLKGSDVGRPACYDCRTPRGKVAELIIFLDGYYGEQPPDPKDEETHLRWHGRAYSAVPPEKIFPIWEDALLYLRIHYDDRIKKRYSDADIYWLWKKELALASKSKLSNLLRCQMGDIMRLIPGANEKRLVTQSSFAKEIGANRSTVCRWAKEPWFPKAVQSTDGSEFYIADELLSLLVQHKPKWKPTGKTQ